MKIKYILVLVIMVLSIFIYLLRYEILALILNPNCNAQAYINIENIKRDSHEHLLFKNLTDYEKNSLLKACSSINEGPVEGYIEANGCDIEKLDEIVEKALLENYTNYYWVSNLAESVSLFDTQNIILEEGKKFAGSSGCDIFKATSLALASEFQVSLQAAIYIVKSNEFEKCIMNQTQRDCFSKLLHDLSVFLEANKLKEITIEDIEKASLRCQNTSRFEDMECEGLPINQRLCGILKEEKFKKSLAELHKRIYDRIKEEIALSNRNTISKFELFVYGKSIEICGYCPDSCIRHIDKITPWKFP